MWALPVTATRGNPAGVVVAVYRGDDHPVGKGRRRKHGTDWDEEEIARKITIHTGQAYAEWAPGGQPAAAGQAEKIKVNFLDTPATALSSTTRAPRSWPRTRADRGGRARGVQVVTEKVWDYATEYDLPRAFAINWMDPRSWASYDRAMESLARVFGRNVVPCSCRSARRKVSWRSRL